MALGTDAAWCLELTRQSREQSARERVPEHVQSAAAGSLVKTVRRKIERTIAVKILVGTKGTKAARLLMGISRAVVSGLAQE